MPETVATASPAIRCGAVELPVTELQSRALRAAGALARTGISTGDRVALLMRNDVRFVEASLAIGLAGAIPVPINSHWSAAEIEHVLSDSGATVLIAHADLLHGIVRGRARCKLISVRDDAADNQGDGDVLDYEAWLADAPPLAQAAPQAPMSVIYTSGTTGAPKGVQRAPIPPERASDVVRLVCTGLALEPGMSTLIPAPLYHTAPNAHALFAVSLGCELTIMPRFDAEELLALVQRHRIVHIQLVPTMFVRLLALPRRVRDSYDVSSLRSVVHAAAACPVAVKQAMIDWWGPIIHEYYGGTEVGIVVATDTEGWLAHPGSVGRPVLDASVRILAPDGTELPSGAVGEVYLRPPSCWPDFSYLGAPEVRSAVEHDGHVTLGDAGHVDEDGYLYLTDRIKDMIISGGVNIYPAEIEQCLLTLPQVRDAAVFGVPNPEWGEVVAAHIELNDGAALTEGDVREHVRRNLANYKAPRIVVFEALPRQDTGKLFKRCLRERYLEAAGPTAAMQPVTHRSMEADQT